MGRHLLKILNSLDLVPVQQITELDSQLVRQIFNEFLVIALILKHVMMDALSEPQVELEVHPVFLSNSKENI